MVFLVYMRDMWALQIGVLPLGRFLFFYWCGVPFFFPTKSGLESFMFLHVLGRLLLFMDHEHFPLFISCLSFFFLHTFRIFTIYLDRLGCLLQEKQAF